MDKYDQRQIKDMWLVARKLKLANTTLWSFKVLLKEILKWHNVGIVEVCMLTKLAPVSYYYSELPVRTVSFMAKWRNKLTAAAVIQLLHIAPLARC